jgi:hypothetical protein
MKQKSKKNINHIKGKKTLKNNKQLEYNIIKS